MTSLFSCPLLVHRGGGRRPGSLAPAPQDCSTSEALSPRTVLTENICGCVQHRPTTMPFITTCTTTLSCLASSAPQADSWWLGHVEPDDVVIANIGGQALDIFLHRPDSASKNGILKANIHPYIQSHSPMRTLKQTKTKPSTHQNTTSSFTCPLPVQCGAGRWPGSLACAPQGCSTSEVFWPRTVLTKTFVDMFSKQQHQAVMPLLTTCTRSLSCLASAAPQADSWWFGHVVPDDVVFADIAGCRHLSPLSRVCVQEWHRKDIHSHIHSHPPMHTPKTNKKQNPQLTEHDAFVYLFSSCPLWWWATVRKLGRCSSRLLHVGGLLALATVLTENICGYVHKYSNISRQQCPF